MPWNLKDEIIAQLVGVRDWGGKFIVPIPRVGGPGLKAMLPLKQLISHDLDYIVNKGGSEFEQLADQARLVDRRRRIPRLLFCRSRSRTGTGDAGRASVSG